MRRWEAWINHAGWTLVAVSGIVYGALKYFVPGADPDSRVAHPLQPAALALHLLAGPVAVFGLGLVFRRHALARWQAGERAGRRTGGVLLVAGLALAVSGYLLQALTGEAARRWLGWSHAAVGLLVAAAYALHPRTSNDAERDLENGAPRRRERDSAAGTFSRVRAETRKRRARSSDPGGGRVRRPRGPSDSDPR